MREQQRAQEQRISQLLAVKGWMRQLKRLPWQEEQQSVQWLEQRLIEVQPQYARKEVAQQLVLVLLLQFARFAIEQNAQSANHQRTRARALVKDERIVQKGHQYQRTTQVQQSPYQLKESAYATKAWALNHLHAPILRASQYLLLMLIVALVR